jgi:hypothetical protein
MKGTHIAFALVAISAAVLVVFNNCSGVNFDDAPISVTDAASVDPGTDSDTDVGSNGDDPGTGTDPNDTPIPVDELENDPTLYDKFKCSEGGVSDGVMVCHFPENVEGQHSMCVGRPSVSTHYDHIRLYNLNGVEKSIGDYLGVCRFPL